MDTTQTHKRLATEDREHWYGYDHNFIFTQVMKITDPHAPVPQGTFKVPFDLSGTDLYNIWTGDDWAVVEAYKEIIDYCQNLPALIDKEVDAIYNSQVGSRQAEYDSAYAQALEWQNAEYESDPPMLVAITAEATGKDPKDVAIEIITIAGQWKMVMAMVRTIRLKAKTRIKALGDTVNKTVYNQCLEIFDQFTKEMEEVKKKLA